MSAPTSSGSSPAADLIRNIVLVGPTHAGKTTLLEALAFTTGAIDRLGSIEAGTTLGDAEASARAQGRSTALTMVALDHDGYRLNLIDTPGYPDFVGEVRAGLRAADAALFVVSAVDPIDETTAMLWNECGDIGMPRAIVITKVDRDNADVEGTIETCQTSFGVDDPILPLYLPLHADDDSVIGLIGLIDEQILDYSSGSEVPSPPDAEHVELIADQRTDLIEGIITESEDETLLERFLAGESFARSTLIADLEAAVARGHFHPIVLTAMTPQGFGLRPLLEVMTRGFPSPLEHALPAVTSPDGDPREPLICDAEGPLCAEVVKTGSDAYVGRLSLVRIFSGTLSPDRPIHVSGHFLADRGHEDHDVDERAGSVRSGHPGAPVDLPRATAGDIVTVTRLQHAETSDTLSDPEYPLLIEPWILPEPTFPVALAAPAPSDDAKFTTALARCVAEDPTLRLERNAETGQVVLWCMGEGHRDATATRISDRSGLEVGFEPVRVALRTTISGPASGTGRVVKQSGGHGQYAVCMITVAPGAPGSGLTFIDKIVGGAIPRSFIPAVERGISQAMQEGVVAHQPLVDIEVTLVDGKAHSVDSSDMAFATAGAVALKDAAAAAGLITLEPVDSVEIEIPEEYLGAVMSDVAGRRGRVVGTRPGRHDRVIVDAQIPAAELTMYALQLRSLAHGTGVFSREFHSYEPSTATHPA